MADTLFKLKWVNSLAPEGFDYSLKLEKLERPRSEIPAAA